MTRSEGAGRRDAPDACPLRLLPTTLMNNVRRHRLFCPTMAPACRHTSLLLLAVIFFLSLATRACIILQASVDSSGGTTTSQHQYVASQRSRIPVLKYCSDWVCVNKPAGISVHPNKRPSQRQSESVLTSRLKRQLHRKVLPVHRLDHRTSGVMVLAFTSESAAQLQVALQEGNKTYLALVRGEWTHSESSITMNKPVLVHDVPKEATTKFTMIATHGGCNDCEFQDRCTLVWCQPLLTGRTHQIRRHAAAMGHPIIGDTEHGDTRINRWWRMNQGLDRLMLHAWSLELSFWPGIDEDQEQEQQGLSSLSPRPPSIVAPLPDDFASVVRRQDQLWAVAVANEPCLETKWLDEHGGTFGRHYRRRSHMESTEAPAADPPSTL